VSSASFLFSSCLFPCEIQLSLGKLFARKNGYDVKASRELFAMGAANTISATCGSFICSASFSRTAVVHAIGAKTVGRKKGNEVNINLSLAACQCVRVHFVFQEAIRVPWVAS
jgi:hypothetical protein